MIFGHSVKGVAEINRRIEGMKPRIKKATLEALDASGDQLLRDAKSRATSAHVKRSLIIDKPSPNIRTLTTRPGEFVSKRFVRAKGLTKSGRRTRRTYQPDEAVRFYRFLELGTKYHAAKPFLVPAAIKFRANGLDTFNDHFKI
jgi:hypothetical protein